MIGRRGRGRNTGLRLATLIALGALAAGGVSYLSVGRPGDLDAAMDSASWTGGRVRIEVLNAGGVTGMARTATGVLREAGFDVTGYGNAATFDPARPSTVIDRVGNMDMALAVAAALGIDNVHSDPDPNLYVDVSVVLGREWVAADVESNELETDRRPWWDPRSWRR